MPQEYIEIRGARENNLRNVSLTSLATEFDRVARPEHGRYVNRPAA
jgi:hypothetical protein